jgi:hypothetical protein
MEGRITGIPKIMTEAEEKETGNLGMAMVTGTTINLPVNV